MMQALFILHLFFSFSIILLVLLQKGSMTTGAPNTSSTGEFIWSYRVNIFLIKFTIILVVVFLITSVFLGSYISWKVCVLIDDVELYSEMLCNKNFNLQSFEFLR